MGKAGGKCYRNKEYRLNRTLRLDTRIDRRFSILNIVAYSGNRNFAAFFVFYNLGGVESFVQKLENHQLIEEIWLLFGCSGWSVFVLRSSVAHRRIVVGRAGCQALVCTSRSRG